MVAHAFDHGDSAGIADCEAIAGAARGEQRTRRSAIQGRIAEENVWRSVRGIGGTAERPNHDFAAAESFSDMIVRLSFEVELHLGECERAETLARTAVKAQTHRLRRSIVAVDAGDLPGDPRANSEMMIADCVDAIEGLTALEDFGIERDDSRTKVAVDRAPARRQRFGRRCQHRRQIERLRPCRLGAFHALQ